MGRKKEEKQTNLNLPDEAIRSFHLQRLCYPSLAGEVSAAGEVISNERGKAGM